MGIVVKRIGAYVIEEVTKTETHHNPISGHTWDTHKTTGLLEVSGNKWTRTKHRSMESALKEVKLRQSIDRHMQKSSTCG